LNNPIGSTDNEALLIVANSHANADLYYASGFLVEMTIVYLEVDGKRTLLLNDLEYGRAGEEADVDEVLSSSPYERKLIGDGKPPSLLNILDLFLKDRNLTAVTVPATTPFSYGRKLEELGYTLTTRDDPFFPQRTVKNAEELAAIEEAQTQMEAAMRHAIDTIHGAEIRGDHLWHDGRLLTSEGLRVEIQKLLLERDCLAKEVIVAGGDQGADPHRRGDGPLPANKTIILDIFGQSLKTRYWGDMTRTVVRGKATSAVKKLYADVLAAQKLALAEIRDGADGCEIHKTVSALLKERDNENGEEGGKKTGFFHGTGHGVGIEIHEAPRISRIGSTLRTNHAVTVEPGLYYPGVGAVRLEDLVIVEKDACRNLNRIEKVLEI
jgi:Xaa-Pro aminopeptidase